MDKPSRGIIFGWSVSAAVATSLLNSYNLATIPNFKTVINDGVTEEKVLIVLKLKTSLGERTWFH